MHVIYVNLLFFINNFMDSSKCVFFQQYSMIRITDVIGQFWHYTGSVVMPTEWIKNNMPSFKIISIWHSFLKKDKNLFLLNIFLNIFGWKQSLLGVCNHETCRLTGCKSAYGWGWGGAGASTPLWSSTSQSRLSCPAPLY